MTILLINPKYAHNVGAIYRSCSCYGVEELIITGKRIDTEAKDGYRLPREERMKGYQNVSLTRTDKPFDVLRGKVPIAVELIPYCEPLPLFEHPKNAVYVFGPEDGSLPSVVLRHCQRFVAIPTMHCLNLATAVSTVLYDRQAKLHPNLMLSDTLMEKRGYD